MLLIENVGNLAPSVHPLIKRGLGRSIDWMLFDTSLVLNPGPLYCAVINFMWSRTHTYNKSLLQCTVNSTKVKLYKMANSMYTSEIVTLKHTIHMKQRTN